MTQALTRQASLPLSHSPLDKISTFNSSLTLNSVDTCFTSKNQKKKELKFANVDIVNIESFKAFNLQNSYNNDYIEYYTQKYYESLNGENSDKCFNCLII